MQTQDQNQQAIIIANILAHPVHCQPRDGWMSLTDLCAAFPGKEPYEFLRTDASRAIIAALTQEADSHPSNFYGRETKDTPGIKSGHSGPKTEWGTENFVQTRRARPDQGGGTWAHPYLAIECARWLSPAFALACNRLIRHLLNGGGQPAAAPASPPPRPAITGQPLHRWLGGSEALRAALPDGPLDWPPVIPVPTRADIPEGHHTLRQWAQRHRLPLDAQSSAVLGRVAAALATAEGHPRHRLLTSRQPALHHHRHLHHAATLLRLLPATNNNN